MNLPPMPEPLALARYLRAGGNVGIAWTAMRCDTDYMPRDGEHLVSADQMRDYGAACYAAGMEAERERAERAEAALAELVALKRLKDDIERWVRDERTGQQWPQMQPYARRMEAVDEYKRRKPAAWAVAFALVDAAAEIRAAMPPKP